MRKIIETLCIILTLLLVLGLRQKPNRERMFPEMNRQAEAVELAVAELKPEQIAHQKNLARWYNYNLELGTSGLEAAYATILNFGQGRMAVLGVPEWELRMAICHGSGGAVNHDPATALPLGDRGDHTVLYLTEELPWEEGLNLYIECLGQRLTYRIESVQVVDGFQREESIGAAGENLLTLVFERGENCTLIRCVRCGELVLRQGEKGVHFPWAAPAAALPVLVLCWIWRRKGSAKWQRGSKNWG